MSGRVTMAQQSHLSPEAAKEPHSVSIKVLRLSRPSLVSQEAVEEWPSGGAGSATRPGSKAASLAYLSQAETNPEPFFLSPMLKLPTAFGYAYVGERFSCTLCANNELGRGTGKRIRDVRLQAEMKTPGSSGAMQALDLGPEAVSGADMETGETQERVAWFDLKEEGHHVLAVTVSYYEATETSGRTRTFRKLYQFICKASLIVRTKVGTLAPRAGGAGEEQAQQQQQQQQQWVLEAQLENCSEEALQLEKVLMELEPGFRYQDCNWESGGGEKPVLHPGEVEQVCFVIEEDARAAMSPGRADARLSFGTLGIGWRGPMGNRGFLSTGRLGARAGARK